MLESQADRYCQVSSILAQYLANLVSRRIAAQRCSELDVIVSFVDRGKAIACLDVRTNEAVTFQVEE